MESSTLAGFLPRWAEVTRFTKKTLKRVVLPAVAAVFLPRLFLAYLVSGLIDVARNRPPTLSLATQYFLGNGVFTWLLSPFNILMDVICLPYWNQGVYRLADLPLSHQAEIQTLIDAVHKRDLVGALEAKMGEHKRLMLFFQWYGRILPASVDIPEFRHRYQYVRTIGVSVFNKRQSTGTHFGPLRATLRVLYNINPASDPNVYIQIGRYRHLWLDQPLLIFDDTLQHESRNDSDALRYCLFVDILRPSRVPWLMSRIVDVIRLLVLPFRFVFYKHWTFIK